MPKDLTLSSENIEKTRKFLDQHIFYDLENLNTGFDSPGIKYFSKDDFEIILDRVESFNLSIFGIEPWPEGRFGGVMTCEDYNSSPSDPKWYRAAFQYFLDCGITSHFAASYGLPDE